jgi:phenylalanyl-tRNA synthetase beta chain
MTLSVPSFRQSDVIREIDLVEEVCRLWGYDRIPETMPASTLAAMPADQTPQKLRSTLAAWGFSEAWLSSLTGSTQALAGYGVASDPVRVLNPLSVEHQVLRQSLLPGLIQAAVYNYSRGRKKIWLFEMGRIYLRSSESGFGTGVIEPEMLSAILVGNPEETNWQGNSIDLDLYRLKGYLENLFSILQIGIEKVRFNQAQGVEDIWHPGRTVEITFSHKPLSLSDDQAVWLGRFGALHPRLCDQHEIRVPAYMFELSLDAIQLVVRPKGFKEVANTPAVFRDITADLMPTVSFSAFKGCIQSEAGSSLQDAQLVSTFKPVGENKSLSVRLRFQHPDKTLTAEEVDVLVDKIKAGLAKKLGATYR